MSLSDHMTRCPRAHDPERGDAARALFPEVDDDLALLVRGAAGSSPYLATLIEKEAAWLPAALDDPDGALEAEIAGARGHGPDGLAEALRRAKRRVALLTALADLGGAWSLMAVTGALTRFADAACDAALRSAIATQIKRGKLPGMTEDDIADAGGMVVFAMGKMGAYELNYSSDIDLICLFDETRFDPADFHDARSAFVRATRAMSATLSDLTAQGYVFRTDLRLRPDPGVTPVCMAMEAAERYYESLGRTWERAAYIKARPAAGDLAAGQRFLRDLRPFVWRRHLDFAAIQDAHDMRLAIREHKGLGGPITLPGHNMKLGRGGIREIEFFTQTRQLIAGGRDAELRVRGTLQGLSVLAQKGWVPEDVAGRLRDHYMFHRTVEHRLQMVQDAQTHSLPVSDTGFARLACLMDADAQDLRQDLTRRLSAVHEMTEGFFAPGKPPEPKTHDFDTSVLHRWYSYPALRSDRSRILFERLRPDLLTRLAGAAKPDEALLAFDGFLAGLPAGVQLFSLLEANPQLRDLLIDIVGTSPALAQYLSRNAGVFDAVIGGDFFDDWPGQAALADALAAALEPEPDYETRLDMARRWTKEWHFRIGVHHLRGLIDADTAGAQYADLARAVLVVLWPLVCDQFARRFGPPPGRGGVVLGMGSLGAGRLNAGSDLDLIVIYDAAGVEASDGPKPLPSRVYYARLTQALITAMTSPMSQGKLYEVDMRLRPSGNQGPVATSWAAFQSYQQTQAWVWEHLALTRAAVITGPDGLARDVEAFRADLLRHKGDPAHVAHEVAQMRARITAAKAPDTLWDAKIGPGRMQEIELIAQAGALIGGIPDRDVVAGLGAARDAGLIDDAGRAQLAAGYALCWRVQVAARLLSAQPLRIDNLGQAGRTFLQRALDVRSLDRAAETLHDCYDACDAVITAALNRYAKAPDAADHSGANTPDDTGRDG
ncbi:glutamine-synthetase adenylyltransferase [Sulfitobacter sabulilitoris]|uniref:Glutamine-synthetase adenylyltransferase n=1 Tax=Sulfitobacter sabulilitoris TaxID=2562655 RepID=A0A5S3PJ58_9RHOB|nr:glutamine-synthetase adenylyltransferase [Sulfitobacter sabulilitoris]TMM54429.1 glutamine-synthetase adenylyltransferase [Sulfitobacter sabulilitoris]